MTLKIIGTDAAICTLRVLAVLHEKGITDWEIIGLKSPLALKEPEHLTLQPFGRIPVLDDEGYILYESRAICKYLARKYAGQGTKLIPDEGDLKEYGKFEQACSIETSYFNELADLIADKKVFSVMKGGPEPDSAEITKLVSKLEGNLSIYDGILAKHAYLAGDEISLADIFHLPLATMLKDIGYGDIFDKFPNVKKWLDGIQGRESWKKCPNTMEFFAKMKAHMGN